eukprot:scaffold1821_cov344-Pavlova_lutheri.AAC.54
MQSPPTAKGFISPVHGPGGLTCLSSDTFRAEHWSLGPWQMHKSNDASSGTMCGLQPGHLMVLSLNGCDPPQLCLYPKKIPLKSTCVESLYVQLVRSSALSSVAV